MAQTIIRSECNLDQGVRLSRMDRLFAQTDKLAHLIVVTVIEYGSAADLSGLSANGYLTRADGTTITFSGTIAENTVTVALPSTCYLVPGHFTIVIKVYDTTHATAIFWGDGTITGCGG